jgi:hypothetical protein
MENIALLKWNSKVELILVAIIFNKEKIDDLSIHGKQHYLCFKYKYP